MDSSFGPNRLDIFEIYRRYCEITSDAYTYKVDDYRAVTLNESKKDKFHRDSLSYLLQQQVPTLEDVSVLMSRLNLMTDSSEFTRFYNFMFFLCRENGQRSITVSRAIMAWKLILSGRFRLLNQWCSFIEKNQRHNISEDTWWQVLSFSRCVHENLEGYDPEGAWPVLIDEFVEHMYRINGSEDAHSVSCSDLEVQLTDDTLPGLKIFPGVKRKLVGDLQDQEFTNFNTVLNSKKRFTDLSTDQTYDCSEAVKQNSQLGSGSLSKGFAELLSSPSCLQFDSETRVPYTL